MEFFLNLICAQLNHSVHKAVLGWKEGENATREATFRVDRWSCRCANWVLRQFGIILDKYLIKKERSDN